MFLYKRFGNGHAALCHVVYFVLHVFMYFRRVFSYYLTIKLK